MILGLPQRYWWLLHCRQIVVAYEWEESGSLFLVVTSCDFVPIISDDFPEDFSDLVNGFIYLDLRVFNLMTYIFVKLRKKFESWIYLPPRNSRTHAL